jgi:hypothetical protein
MRSSESGFEKKIQNPATKAMTAMLSPEADYRTQRRMVD